MKFFKDDAGGVFAFEADGSQDDFIPANLTAITKEEADALRNPPVAPAELKAAAWERIKAERDRRIQQGGYQAAGKWFHSDTFSRTQQMGLVMLGASLPSGVQWKAMGGDSVPMTTALAQQIFSAAAASDIAIFAAAEAHRVAMMASADPAAYDFSGGWPLAFGE